jgi:replicative DNA helicase
VSDLSSPQAERALCCCLMNAEHHGKVLGVCLSMGIKAEHFVNPAHAAIYRAVSDLHSENEPIDFITVTKYLRDSGILEECGGASYVTETGIGHGIPANTRSYCAEIDETRRMRAANQLAIRIQSDLKGSIENLPEWLSRIADEASGLGSRRGQLKTPTESARQFLEFYEQIETAAPMVSCGIDAIDMQAGPFMRSDLVIVSGVTGGGKSALVNSFIDRSIDIGQCCAVFTQEMSSIQYLERIVSARKAVNMHGVRQILFKKQRVHEEVFARISDAVSDYARSNVWLVDDISELSELEGKALQIHARKKLDMIVLDYAQLLSAPGDTREREVANVSKGMKNLARKLDCVAVLLSQLNDDGRLRESRALGHDANVVLNIERDDRSTWVRVSKGRSCPSGTKIPLKWIPEFTKFENFGASI